MMADILDDSDILIALAEERATARRTLANLTAAISIGDAEAAVTALIEASQLFILPQAIRRIARLHDASDSVREAFLAMWVYRGDHLRQEAGSDLELIDALRVMLPPYRGPSLTLYRGDGAWNRRRRTYGLSWTTSVEVARGFAAGIWRNTEGGSVVVRCDAPAEAIICAPSLEGSRYDEAEFLVDRRRLGRVRLVERYSACRPSGAR